MSIVKATAAGLATAAIWGAWPVYSQVAVVEGLSAMDVSILRFGIAGLLLAPLVLRNGLGGLTFLQAAVLSAGAGLPYVLAQVGGLSYAPAGHGGIITPSAMLLAATFGGWLILGERPARSRLLGLAVIIMGIVLTGLSGWENGNAGTLRGDLLFVLGGCLWALYTVCLRAFRADPFQATAVVSVFSLILTLPVWLLSNPDRLAAVDPVSLIGHAGFQGILAAVGALYFYSYAVGFFGAARGALFSAMVPGVAVVLAIPVLDQTPEPTTWAGLACTTGGMLIAFGAVQAACSSLRKYTLLNPFSDRRSVSR